MNLEDILRKYQPRGLDAHERRNVTYIISYRKKIKRLQGSSNILYIGKTEQEVLRRIKQEITTEVTEGNSQSTNIRTTHVLEKLGLKNVSCFFVNIMDVTLNRMETDLFVSKCRFWDKKFYSKLNYSRNCITIPLEKYLLVTYADEHLELPPMNNRM